jgi:hypothetical protein
MSSRVKVVVTPTVTKIKVITTGTTSMGDMTETATAKVMTADERINLGNQSGTNTGDQDLTDLVAYTDQSGLAKSDAEKLQARVNTKSALSSINNVKDFGATGDGSTDDTAAIQATIDDTTNDTIYLPKGTYKISAALVLRSNITIRGDGRQNTKIWQNDDAENGFEYPVGSGAHRCTFEDFQIEANGSSTNTGYAFSMRSTVPAYYFRHRWTNVLVEDFGGAYDVHQSTLTTWINCQCFKVGAGWNLDQVDTPILIGCGINGSANEALFGLRAYNNTLSGQILGGEWGSTQRCWSFEQGNWVVVGSNIETNTKDGIIYIVGESTRVNFSDVKVLAGVADTSTNAIILCETDSSISNSPHFVWNDGHISNGGGGWRNFVLRGNRYYLLTPIVNQSASSPVTVYFESGATGLIGGGLGGTQRGDFNASLPFGSWNFTQTSSVGNTEGGNESRNNLLVQTLPHPSLTGYFGDLVYFYKHKDNQHFQTSLSNDTLRKVILSVNDDVSTVGATPLTFATVNIPKYWLSLDGEEMISVTRGRFGSTANSKTLGFNFGNTPYTKAVTHQDKDFIFTVSILRQSNTIYHLQYKLEVDGELTSIESLTNTQSGTTTVRLIEVTGLGVANDDIVFRNSRLVWENKAADYHQTP